MTAAGPEPGERQPGERQPEEPQKVLLVTGMSGAGKTTALKALEDLGYETVDNIPLSLLASLVVPAQRRFATRGLASPLAIGVDIRTRDFTSETLINEVDRLTARTDVDVRLVFIDSTDDELERRYDETRHRHPLAVDRPIRDGIRHERALMAPLRSRADEVIDTTDMEVGDLKREVHGRFPTDADPALSVFVTSFSFRRGVPREADLVFDVRFLANPHYVAELKPLNGRDPRVAAYVEADPGYAEFLDNLTRLLRPLLPRYRAEGKSYLTIAVGCTGGRHRSVAVAEALGRWLSGEGQRVQVRHRDS